ncbi:MAG TPA: hypothetical protein VF069_00825 [Streptosporangiaceae bacterium]
MGGAARGGLKRLYVVEFDSLSQRHLVALGRTPFGADATSSFVAMMRLADLLSETVVLTDNAIFDGIMFHRLGPRRTLQLVGRPVGASLAFPFEIRSRAASMEDALLRALRDPDATWRDRLNPFEFTALELPEAERIEVGQRLGELRVRELDRRVDKLGVADGIAELLVERCGVPADKVRALQDGWGAWIRADQDGMLTIRPAGERGDADDDRAFAVDPVAKMRADLTTEEGRRALQWVDDNRHERRTTIRARLRDWLPDGPDGRGADRRVIELWHNACYLRSLAYAQGAELIEYLLGDPRAAARRRLVRRGRSPATDGRGETRQVMLPQMLITELGTMPRSVFETVLYRNRDAISNWRLSGDPSSMRRVAYGLLDAADQPDPTSLSRETATRLLLVVVAAFVADVFQGVPWLVKAPVLLGTVLAGSWYDVRTWVRLRGRLGAVIDLREAAAN